MTLRKIADIDSRRKGPNEHWECATGITCVELNHGKCTLLDTKNYPIIAPYRWSAKKGLPPEGPRRARKVKIGLRVPRRPLLQSPSL